jgi:hypothetical protein
VKVGDGGTGPDYLIPCATAVEAAEMGETTKVGVYKLVEMQNVKGVAITNSVKRRSR